MSKDLTVRLAILQSVLWLWIFITVIIEQLKYIYLYSFMIAHCTTHLHKINKQEWHIKHFRQAGLTKFQLLRIFLNTFHDYFCLLTSRYMLYNQQYRIIFILSALYISVLLHHLLTESSCTPVSQTQEVVVAVVVKYGKSLKKVKSVIIYFEYKYFKE